MNTEIEELIRQNSEESLAVLSEKKLSDAETEFLLAKSQEEEYQWFAGEFLMIYDQSQLLQLSMPQTIEECSQIRKFSLFHQLS